MVEGNGRREEEGGRERKERKSGIVAAVLKEQEASASAKGHAELSTNRINDSQCFSGCFSDGGRGFRGLGAPHRHEPRLVSVRYALMGRGEGPTVPRLLELPQKVGTS